MSAGRAALEHFVRETTGRAADLHDFGPAQFGYAIGRLEGYPAPGLTTAITIGVAGQTVSRWRGLPLGYELVLTVAGDPGDLVQTLEDAVLENHRRRSGSVDRRPFLAPNGVWAPGYAPHLVFTTAATATPLLAVEKKKLGDRYVTFLSAVPVDDRELREYDRDAAAFVAALAVGGRVATYPRPAP